MRVSVIAAVAENGVIGKSNALPWHLPTDLKHFRRLTTGHAVIMGRRNYESIGRALPDRTNVVVTHRTGFDAPGCVIAHTLGDAFAACRQGDEVFVIGGADIYAQTLGSAEKLYLTRVHAAVAGDVFFPPVDWSAWRETGRVRYEPDERHQYPYSFLTFERRA